MYFNRALNERVMSQELGKRKGRGGTEVSQRVRLLGTAVTPKAEVTGKRLGFFKTERLEQGPAELGRIPGLQGRLLGSSWLLRDLMGTLRSCHSAL